MRHISYSQYDVPLLFRDRLGWLFQEGVTTVVTEGPTYSAEEQAKHGRKDHDGIDIAAPEGTPIFSPFDGKAFAGIQIHPIEGPDQQVRGMGGGTFVEACANDGLRMQFLHLQDVGPNIELVNPVQTKHGFWSPYRTLDSGNLAIPDGTPIKKGQLIGWVGHSGLADVGHTESIVNIGRVPSWDEDHVHVWVGFRSPRGRKVACLDPFWLDCDDLDRYYAAVIGPSCDMWIRDARGMLIPAI